MWDHFERLCSGSVPDIQVSSIGECGLDASGKIQVSRNEQLNVFLRQIEISNKLNLPLVLHLRCTEQEGVEILSQNV